MPNGFSSFSPNSEAGAAEAAGGTGNLPVPAGYQPAGQCSAPRREIVGQGEAGPRRHPAGW